MSGPRTYRRSLRASAPRFVQLLSVRDEEGVKILECHVDGYPRPEIRWEKSGKIVGKSRRIHMLRSGEMCLLQIRMPQADDFGTYTCSASNIMGTASTHVKISTAPQQPIKKLNGTTPHTLSPVRSIGLRSRSMDRSKESVGDKSQCSRGARSRSASRNSRQDAPVSTKSKISNFTNSLWKRNGTKNSQKLEIVTPSKKELSKSVEDCRKSRKSILNKVKIPDIFVSQKQEESLSNGKLCLNENRSLVNQQNFNTEITIKEIKVNGSLTNGSLKNETMKDLHVPKSENNGQISVRGRIASYLKRLENPEPPVRLKGPRTVQRASSLKQPKTDKNTDRRGSEHVDSEKTFKLGRFMRRKSSGGGKKSPELSTCCKSTFVSHIQQNFGKDMEVLNNKSTGTKDSRDIINSCNEIQSVTSDTNGRISVEVTPSNDMKEMPITVIPDITGFTLITDSPPKREESNKHDSKHLLTNTKEDNVKEIHASKKDDHEINTLQDGRNLSLDSVPFTNLPEVQNTQKSMSAKDVRSIPRIHVEIPENEEEFHVNGEIDTAVEEIPLDFDEVTQKEISSNRKCAGQISYSEPLLEECEDLLEANAQTESLESNLQRVSSPVESPARIIKGPQSVTVLRGESVTLAICFTGNPVPNVMWIKGSLSFLPEIDEGMADFTIQETVNMHLTYDAADGNAQKAQRFYQELFPTRRVPDYKTFQRLHRYLSETGSFFRGNVQEVSTPQGRVLQCSSEGRLTILEGREMSVVTVNEVTADDSGKYVVCVENEGGGDSRFASVAVVGFPEPPGGEPTASEVTDHSLVLSWYGSMYDGGSVVTGYEVEMCTFPDKKWHKVASSVNTSCAVQGLSMGQKYIFRVRAENRYGLSHPSKESKVICLNDFLQYDTSSDEEPEDMLESSVQIENGTLFAERFDLKEEVGKGKFGTVYRCVELSCGRARAAKVIRCLKMKDKEKVRQEIEIMSRLQHPKLMQVLAAFESGRNMIMVMEFISGGELFERVIADDFVLTEHDCILFMRQILDGVAYMHRNAIIHLDLKPENILCKTRTSHKIKIIDFGLARVFKPDESLRILFGTPEFVAPEVISYEPVSPASDMWSVGVICYVLLSGLSPFMGDNDTETFANITRGEMDFDDEAFDEISQDAKDFISGLLIKKIKGRMSAEECLKHPWLATARLVQKRPLSTEKLKRFIIRRKWQKSGTAIRALGRMVSLSRSSLGSSCDSYSPVGSPTSSRSRSSLVSRSETAESGDSVFSR